MNHQSVGNTDSRVSLENFNIDKFWDDLQSIAKESVDYPTITVSELVEILNNMETSLYTDDEALLKMTVNPDIGYALADKIIQLLINMNLIERIRMENEVFIAFTRWS